jgi:membrane protease YdiL (CAAX protease family)
MHDPFGDHAQGGRGAPSALPAGDSLAPPVGPSGPPGPPAGAPLDSSLGPVANDWPVWTGFVALLSALMLAAVGGLIVDIPAVVLGVNISSHIPPGLELADTVVQDVAFVLTVVLFAQLGGRAVRSWQFGLCPTPARRAAGLVALTILAFLAFSVIWAVAVNTPKEKLLEQLGANETTLLLALSALLTTVIAPISEEILFRGYIFAALSKWKGWLPAAAITGVLFGGVHAGSAPVADLVPLAVLGFALCMLYRRTGSLYPCIATHSLNNSLAFGVLEGWGWQIPVLMVAALATIWLLALISRQIGLISAVSPNVAVAPTSYDRP